MSLEMIHCGEDMLDRLAEFYDRVVDHLDATVNYPKWVKGVYPARGSITLAIEKGEQWACLDGESIVGAFRITADVYPPASWSVDLRDGEYRVLHSFATLPELRGRGVGRRMLDGIVAHLRREGFRAIRIDVVPANLPAIRLYESVGFRFVEALDLGDADIPLFNLYELIL